MGSRRNPDRRDATPYDGMPRIPIYFLHFFAYAPEREPDVPALRWGTGGGMGPEWPAERFRAGRGGLRVIRAFRGAEGLMEPFALPQRAATARPTDHLPDRPELTAQGKTMSSGKAITLPLSRSTAEHATARPRHRSCRPASTEGVRDVIDTATRATAAAIEQGPPQRKGLSYRTAEAGSRP